MRSRAAAIANKRVTLKEVGEYAGVSAITVSRCLNSPEKVSKELREQVEAAVAALGYIPNQFARSLASSRSKIIGVTVPSLTNTVFTDVLDGINHVMDGAGFRVLMADTRYSDEQEEKMLRTFLSQSPEALIVTGGNQSSQVRQLIINARIPVVQIMELVDEPIDMNIGFSHSQAGKDVAAHLLTLGKKRIGFIGARMDPRVLQRKEGFCSAIAKAGCFKEEFIELTQEPSSIAMGGELFRRLVARLATQKMALPQALFCANDDLALGALFEAQRQGIEVPKQLAICGFNDVEASTYVNPSLTSVSVGRYDMGVKAAELILKAINGETITKKIIKTPYQINVRQSTSGKPTSSNAP